VERIETVGPVAAIVPEGSGAIVVHRSLARALPSYEVTGYNPWATLLLPPLLYRYRPARRVRAVHTSADHGLFFARTGIPLLLTFHNYVLDPFMRAYSSPLQNLHYRTDLRYFIRHSLRLASAVSAVSHATADLVRRDLGYEGNIDVIANGVDEVRFRPRPRRNDGPVRVLFSGNLTRRKGAQWLEAIGKRLPSSVQLFCATGLGTRTMRLPQEVRRVGSVPHGRMPELYTSMDMLLMPTVREGLSLSVLEAMACGLPIVATNISSLPEQVHQGLGGLLCPLGDADAFAVAIKELAADPARRRQMGEYNRARIEQAFTLRTMAHGYAEWLDRVL
jgi:glycosyltransferase involved in cell wall biosynthesis